MGGTTQWNEDTGLLNSAPREAGGADALTGLAIMAGRNWAVDRECVASGGKGAEAGSDLEIDTLATLVMVVATAWNYNAQLGCWAPALSRGADTLACLTIVVSNGGTIKGDIVALVGNSTPAGVCDECQARSAVVVGSTTSRDSDASSKGSTPTKSCIADALKSLAIVVNRAN